jgi:hypothetical protein
MILFRRAFLALPLAAFLSSASNVADMSGTWFLDVNKSRWGRHAKAQSAVVKVEHHEPALKYSGTVVAASGGGETTQEFSFDGAIDGKEYPLKDTAGEKRMTFQRVNPSTVKSVLKAADGTVVETATTTISRDGKTMQRDIEAKGRNGEVAWTEFYDRR